MEVKARSGRPRKHFDMRAVQILSRKANKKNPKDSAGRFGCYMTGDALNNVART